jgi:hypothetical protein
MDGSLVSTSAFGWALRRLSARGAYGLVLACMLAPLLAACVSGAVAPPAATVGEEQQYAMVYPYYAELCAVSQLDKKPGFGADISSGFGGHGLLYLNRVCRRQDTDYPVLQMCDEQPARSGADGVGLSVNAHYSNAEWVAVEGRDFFFKGGLADGQPLTRETYRRVLAEAQDKRIYDGVTFHDEVYDGMPAGFTRRSFQYEVSAATDFAIKFGRNRYCARIPVSRPQMVRIVDYLNRANEPYRSGRERFDWNVLTHNCSHVNHNALAAGGLWDEWPMDRFILISMFDFPVPKNEFVNAMRRANDLPIDDPEAVFDDEAARKLLLEEGRLPTEPGAIADLDVIAQPNEVYGTESRIIFYDDPILGVYQRRFNEILTEPRYFRLRDNLLYFSNLYERIADERKPLDWYLAKRKEDSERERNAFKIFYEKYYDYVGRQRRVVAQQMALIDSMNR